MVKNNREEAIARHLEYLKSCVDSNRESEALKKLGKVLDRLPTGNRHTLSLELENLAGYARAIAFLEESDSRPKIFYEMREVLAEHLPGVYDPSKIMDTREYDNTQICDMFLSALHDSADKRKEFFEAYK